MSVLTPSQQQGVNIACAAESLFQAELHKFQATTYVGTGQEMAKARDEVHAALDALLDAKARLTVLVRS